MTKLSWRDVLDCKEWAGHIDVMYKRAKDAKYRFFTFNGRVYEILINPDEFESNYRQVCNISDVI